MLIAQLKTTIILITLFLAVSITAKAIGTLQPPNPALRGFIEGCEDKPQPCWYGIVPGETTGEEMRHLVSDIPGLKPIFYAFTGDLLPDFQGFSNMPDEVTCQFTVDIQNGIIIEMILSFCEPYIPRFGDLALTTNLSDRFLNTNLLYYSDKAFIASVFSDEFIRWSPYNTFHQIKLNTPIERARTNSKWKGFMFFWRYCRQGYILCPG